MSKLPSWGDSADEAKRRVNGLIPWLESPHSCQSCGEYCLATVVFDPHMVEYTDAWVCPNCDSKYYRERI